MDDTRIEQAKFDVGGSMPAIDAGELPWSYGEDRITAMVRDPESAYLYWEVTDGGIARARERLGPSGPGGRLALRIYDTSGRSFDGTNAHDYFDIRVDRSDREYFLLIRRPGSTLHAEIGLLTPEGYYQAIARSGGASFPRSEPSPDGSVTWRTLPPTERHPCARPYRSRFGVLQGATDTAHPSVVAAGEAQGSGPSSGTSPRIEGQPSPPPRPRSSPTGPGAPGASEGHPRAGAGSAPSVGAQGLGGSEQVGGASSIGTREHVAPERWASRPGSGGR